jgi:hypothetical protein
MRLKMPEVIRVNLSGKLRPGVNAKDVVLEMLRINGVKGGLGKVFEYTGDGVSSLSVPERGTIANMGAEMGATTSIFPADAVVREFFRAQNRETEFREFLPDQGCTYDGEIAVNMSALEPLAACPHSPDNIKPVSELKDVKVQQVYIGSCTNASYGDIAKAAAILKGKTVHEDVSLTVSVSTRQIFQQLLADGVIADLLASGARITENACGACCGIGQAPATNGVSVRTSNRNFQGRGGTSDAFLYLVSPETAAASAVTGFITSPAAALDDISALTAIREPAVYPVNDNLLIPPLPPGEAVKARIIRGPNIKPLPVNQKTPETIHVDGKKWAMFNHYDTTLGFPPNDLLFVFPAEMNLVVKSQKYKEINFDYIQYSHFVKLVSEKFFSFLIENGLDESYYEIARLNIVDTKGRLMTDNKYFALRFGRFDDALFNFPSESRKRAAGLRDRFLFPDMEFKTVTENKNIFVLFEFCYKDGFLLNAKGANYVIENFYCEIYNAKDFPFVFNNQYNWDILPFDNKYKIDNESNAL